jgi:hypothetical protein
MKIKLKEEQKEGIYWAIGLVGFTVLQFIYQEYFAVDSTAMGMATGIFFLFTPVALFSVFAPWLSAEHQHVWRMVTLRWVTVMLILMLYLPTTGTGFLSVNGEYLGIVFAPLLTLRYIIFFIRKK